MKIKFGALVVDGRGKLGGHVLAKNRSGNYMRTKVTPTNPQTLAQSAARILFALISQAWSSLSVQTIQAWNSAVSQWQSTDIFGDLKNPSGKALFQRLNNQAQSAGYPAVTSPPERVSIPNLDIDGVLVTLGTSSIDVSQNTADPGVRVMVFATPPLSRGTTFVKDQLRLISTYVGNNPDGDQLWIDYSAKYDSPEAGNNIYFAVKIVAPNGQASPIQTFKANIV